MSDEDYHPIGLALSGGQLSKLRNGHRCNVKCSGSGAGSEIFIKAHKLKELLKKAKAGKGHQLHLDHDEIAHNKMKGSGLHHGLKRLSKEGTIQKKHATSEVPRKDVIAHMHQHLSTGSGCCGEDGSGTYTGGKVHIGKKISKAFKRAKPQKFLEQNHTGQMLYDKAMGGMDAAAMMEGAGHKGLKKVGRTLHKAGKRAKVQDFFKHNHTAQTLYDKGMSSLDGGAPQGSGFGKKLGKTLHKAGKRAKVQDFFKGNHTAQTFYDKGMASMEGGSFGHSISHAFKKAKPQKFLEQNKTAQTLYDKGMSSMSGSGHNPFKGSVHHHINHVYGEGAGSKKFGKAMHTLFLDGSGLYAGGRGLYAGGRGLYASGGSIGEPDPFSIANVGAGGNLLHAHPALRSDAQSAFFNMGPQLHMGGGVYGSL